MALRWEDIQRLKYETGYNVANVGAEIYVLNGYAAVFDAAIAPYLVDQGSTSTTLVGPYATAQNVPITVLANPNVSGNQVNGPPANPNQYGKVFQVGSRVAVDVGPAQEAPIIVLAVDPTGLILTLPILNAHGVGGTSYPISLYGGEFLVRDVLSRLDVINSQLKGYAPGVAGLKKADQAEFHASQRGRRGQSGPFDDLVAQRDMARRDLCALLGIENLWELRGRHGPMGGSAGLSYERH